MLLSPDVYSSIRSKVKNHLTDLIYPSLLSSIPFLIAIGSILAFKLSNHVNHIYLGIWVTSLILVATFQAILSLRYKKIKDPISQTDLYFKLLILDVCLVGAVWGAAGLLFMPADALAQSYLIFCLVFVTGGGLVYLAGSFLASALYASFILVPLITSLMLGFFHQPHHEIYSNVVMGVVCYWIFLLSVSYFSSKLFSENYVQSIVNQSLSNALSEGSPVAPVAPQQVTTRSPEETPPTMHKTLTFELGQINALPITNSQEILEIKFVQSRAYARRHQQSLGVFIINVNNLNEPHSLEKEAGDAILKTAAIRLLYCKRETDILARWDENKFVLIVSEIVFGNEIPIVANKILKIFAENNAMSHGGETPLDTSIGISVYPRDGENLPELIQHAETALKYLLADPDSDKAKFIVYNPDIEIATQKSLLFSAKQNSKI